MPEGQVLAPGAAEGATLVLDEPLSFWGGLDARSGRIVDRRHPQLGRQVTGRILVMPSGRGSSSSSSVLAEAPLLGTGPVGIILQRADPIVVLGVVVADELYGTGIPVVVLEAADYVAVAKMKRVAMEAAGVIRAAAAEPA
jgi:uncharacterized protein